MPEARYRLFRRASGMFYQQDHETGVQVSLRTKDKHAAQEKLRAANESVAHSLRLTDEQAGLCFNHEVRFVSSLLAIINLELPSRWLEPLFGSDHLVVAFCWRVRL